MKKIAFTIACLFSLAAFAQTTSLNSDAKTGTVTTFGAKVGAFNYDFNGKDLTGDKSGLSGTSFYGGFFADTQLSEHWSLENELLFANADDILFIQVPVHLKYHFADKWKIFLGPRLDFNVNDPEGLGVDQYKPFGVSIELGVQYDFYKRFFVEIRGSYGLTKQFNLAGYDSYNSTLNSLGIGVGYKF